MPNKKMSQLGLALMLDHLGLLLENNLSVPEALDALLSEQLEGSPEHTLLTTTLAKVKQGRSLADGLVDEKRLFHAIDLALLSHAEEHHTLTSALRRMAEEKERLHETDIRVSGIIHYPISVSLVMVVIIAALMIYVVPIWADLFQTFGAVLPLPTRILIEVSNVFQQTWWIMAILLFGAFRIMNRRPQWKAWLLGHIPGIRNIQRHLFLMRFANLFATLLEIGQPATIAARQAMQCALPGRDLSGHADTSVVGALRNSGDFPESFIRQVAVGERVGNLAAIMSRTARFHEDRLMQVSHVGMDQLQTLMTLLVALLVGFVVISVYLPLFLMGSMTS